jgi:hypothetical protein
VAGQLVGDVCPEDQGDVVAAEFAGELAALAQQL